MSLGQVAEWARVADFDSGIEILHDLVIAEKVIRVLASRMAALADCCFHSAIGELLGN